MKGLLVLAIAALAAQIPGEPRPHGPYANQEGVKCWRNETVDQPNNAVVKKLVHCECDMVCTTTGEPSESSRCETYCDSNKKPDDPKKQCLCHADEGCPIEPPKRKKR